MLPCQRRRGVYIRQNRRLHHRYVGGIVNPLHLKCPVQILTCGQYAPVRFSPGTNYHLSSLPRGGKLPLPRSLQSASCARHNKLGSTANAGFFSVPWLQPVHPASKIILRSIQLLPLEHGPRPHKGISLYQCICNLPHWREYLLGLLLRRKGFKAPAGGHLNIYAQSVTDHAYFVYQFRRHPGNNLRMYVPCETVFIAQKLQTLQNPFRCIVRGHLNC